MTTTEPLEPPDLRRARDSAKEPFDGEVAVNMVDKSGVTAVEPESPRTEEKRYSSFTEVEKWGIITLSAIGSITSPISSNIYVPAIPLLSKEFNVSPAMINLTITIFLIFQAITPAFWGSAADAYGRRPVYIATVLIWTLACLGTALCPTDAYWLLMVLRIIQSSGGSATIAIGAGVVSDVARPQERGKYLGLFNFTSTFGPSIGPLLGGVLAGTLGWRSIFWFLTIMGGVILVPMILFLPETLRSLVGDGSLPPPILNCTPLAYYRRRKRGVKVVIQERTKYAPLTSFLLLLEPDLLLILLWASIYYSLYYAVLTIFSTLLKDHYGWGEILIGVGYISNGIGTAIGSVGTGLILDRIYKAEKKRVGGDHRQVQEFRLERTRFIVLPFHAGICLSCAIALGWTLYYSVHVSAPIILNFVFGLGTGLLTTATIYGIDLMPGKGGAVTASFNFTRCLLGAVEVGTVQLINKRMGAGWMFVLLSGLCLVFTPLPLIVLRKGPVWRRRRDEKRRRKEETASDGSAATTVVEAPISTLAGEKNS